MEDPDVYSPTTTADQQTKARWITVPSAHLDTVRFGIKAVEVLLSFVAFVLEEIVNNCTSCAPLYFFEFVSCTAFLFTLLLLILLITPMHKRVGITCWPHLDLGYTFSIFLLFLIASIVFAADNGGLVVEKAAVAFGFLASLAFLADLGLFVKSKGIPCGKKPPSAGDAATAGPPVPESQKLTANGNE